LASDYSRLWQGPERLTAIASRVASLLVEDVSMLRDHDIAVQMCFLDPLQLNCTVLMRRGEFHLVPPLVNEITANVRQIASQSRVLIRQSADAKIASPEVHKPKTGKPANPDFAAVNLSNFAPTFEGNLLE
jgi:hypothetical protein